MTLLNVGSGDLPAPPPWINVDAWPGVHPDVCADARTLPFPDGSVEAVFCGHLLEHLDLDVGVPTVLAEFRRVLQSGGLVCFVGPDYDRALVVDPDPVLLEVIRTGGGRWPGDRHLWLSTGATALSAIRRVFPGAVDVPVADVDKGWPIHARVGWQFAIAAVKE